MLSVSNRLSPVLRCLAGRGENPACALLCACFLVFPLGENCGRGCVSQGGFNPQKGPFALSFSETLVRLRRSGLCPTRPQLENPAIMRISCVSVSPKLDSHRQAARHSEAPSGKYLLGESGHVPSSHHRPSVVMTGEACPPQAGSEDVANQLDPEVITGRAA
jgi:hypothetical protein